MIKTTVGAPCKAHKVQKRWGGIERDAARLRSPPLYDAIFAHAAVQAFSRLLTITTRFIYRARRSHRKTAPLPALPRCMGVHIKKRPLSYLRSLCFEAHRKPVTTYSQKEPNDGIEKYPVRRVYEDSRLYRENKGGFITRSPAPPSNPPSPTRHDGGESRHRLCLGAADQQQKTQIQEPKRESGDPPSSGESLCHDKTSVEGGLRLFPVPAKLPSASFGLSGLPHPTKRDPLVAMPSAALFIPRFAPLTEARRLPGIAHGPHRRHRPPETTTNLLVLLPLLLSYEIQTQTHKKRKKNIRTFSSPKQLMFCAPSCETYGEGREPPEAERAASRHCIPGEGTKGNTFFATLSPSLPPSIPPSHRSCEHRKPPPRQQLTVLARLWERARLGRTSVPRLRSFSSLSRSRKR